MRLTAGELLERERVARDLSVWGFARLLAGDDATRLEVEEWRRAFYRYRKGGTPMRDKAETMEKRLGLEPDSLLRYDQRRPREDGGMPRSELTAHLGALEDLVQDHSVMLQDLVGRVRRLEQRRVRAAR